MTERLCCCYTELGLFLQHFSKQICLFGVQFVKLWPSQHQIALTIHWDDLLACLSCEKMAIKYDVVENAARTEDIAYW